MVNNSSRHAIGVDFGGTSVKIGLVDDRGTIIEHQRIMTADLKGREAWLDAVCGAIDGLKGDLKIAGVGVGVPGFVDHERGYIHNLANVPGWQDVPLADLLRERLGMRVFVDNDVNAMAIGECTFGAGRTYPHTVFVTLGTGVGGALMINNQLYRGAHSMAGEIGHISIDMNGRPSPQGKGGLEQYVGNRPFVEHALEALRAGRHSILDEMVGGDRSKITPKEIKEGAIKGDDVCMEVMKLVTSCIGTAFASIAYMIQPQAFIIGGGVAQDGDHMFDMIRAEVKSRLSPYFYELLEIKPAELGNQAGVIGCATMALIE